MLAEGSQLGDKCSVKRSVIGRHCRIGSNVKVIILLLCCFMPIYYKFLCST
jgi:NDP-sugar pyrophosphorylase family protein